MSNANWLRARGAAVLIQLEDGAMILAELPRPHVVGLRLRVEDDFSLLNGWGERIYEHRSHFLSIEISDAPGGTYTYVSAEGVADWFARRARDGWDQPALEPAPPELPPG